MTAAAKVLVFGGSGFLGSYVVDALVDAGHRVTNFDKEPSRWRSDLPFIQGSILDRRAVFAAVKGFDIVYNFAGAANLDLSIQEPLEFLELNIMGNANVVEAARQAKVTRFIYASSAYVLSRKGAFYGTSKRCSERIIEQYHDEYGLDYTIMRYGSVYGERADASNRIYRLLRQALKEGKIVFPGDGSEEREYIHARDAAQLSVQILDPAYKNQSYILTGIERFSYSRLLEMMREILGGAVQIEYEDREYKGHYQITPYSFTPAVGKKLISNPCIDFGQGLLQCIEHLHREMNPDAEI